MRKQRPRPLHHPPNIDIYISVEKTPSCTEELNNPRTVLKRDPCGLSLGCGGWTDTNPHLPPSVNCSIDFQVCRSDWRVGSLMFGGGG